MTDERRIDELLASTDRLLELCRADTEQQRAADEAERAAALEFAASRRREGKAGRR